MPLDSGAHLGPYQIIAPLGRGGMGEVYRARDARLDRDVAVKILSERLAKDSDALTRFEREAKAVAALSHPNILAIHDVGSEQGTSFVVTELLEGETLRDRLCSSALPWRKAVETAGAIAQGLAAAHTRGIIHRDLKPENIFLTTDGVVKILDFGLARMEQPSKAEDQAAIPTKTIDTRPGTILGTVNYMSPEQVRAKKADATSDIFALGCVLYEMVTGERAFSGETAPETMTAILKHHPPDPTDSGIQTPPELNRVIRRCLEKRPDERFHSASDLAFTLSTILSDSGTSRSTVGEGAPRASKSWWPVVGVGAVALAGIVYLSQMGRSPGVNDTAAPRVLQPRRITNFTGRQSGQTISPEGGNIAYSHNASGPMDIFIRRLEGGPPRLIIESPFDDLAPRWSPVGDKLAFVSGRGPGVTASIYWVPVFGGDERKIVDSMIPAVESLGGALRILGATPWSPDAKQLLFSRAQSDVQTAIWKIDLETDRHIQMTSPPAGKSDLSAAWSPDGKQICFERTGGHGGNLWLLPAEGGEPALLLGGDQYNHRLPAWSSNGHTIVFASNLTGVTNLWEIDVDSKQMVQLTFDPSENEDPVVSADGRILYNQFSHQTDLFVMSMSDGTERQITTNTEDNFGARFSPDGKWIAYLSTRGGSNDIWRLDYETGAELQLTDYDGAEAYPDWSSDGREIVFVSDRDGPFRLYIMNADGSSVRLVSGEDLSLVVFGNRSHFNRSAEQPRWSPDGRVIGYLGLGEKGKTLMTIEPNGGTAQPTLSGVDEFV